MAPQAEGVKETGRKRGQSRKSDGKPTESYIELGKQAGRDVQEAISMQDSTIREILLNSAAKLKGDQVFTKDWLEGYGEVMGRTKKSEAKAVFDGYNSDKGMETLRRFKGGYHDFIKLARQLRDGKEEGEENKSRATPSRSKKITAIQLEAIVDKVQVATTEQAMTVIDKAASAIIRAGTKEQPWEVVMLREIEVLTNRLKLSGEKKYANIGESIYGVVSAVMATIDAEATARKAAEDAKAQAEEAKLKEAADRAAQQVQAPQPAVAPPMEKAA